MSSFNPSRARAATAASRVWSIPHIRLSILQTLASAAANEAESFELRLQARRETLLAYLTLDRATFRDIAFLLYPSVDLDEFPWDSTCEERTRLYAAGVNAIRAGGCLPLCSRWDSLSEMLDFFPNARRVAFNTTGDVYLRFAQKNCSGRPPDELRMVQKVRHTGSAFCAPKVRHLPEGLDYECWYHLEESVTADRWSIASFDRDARGELILPDVLRLPAYQLSLWGTDSSSPDWFHVLRRRKALGVATHSILWRLMFFDELDMLADVAGVGLLGLEVLCCTEVFEDASQAATTIMNRIDATRFPDLESLTIHIDFPSPDAPAVPPVAPEWLSKDMPPQLSAFRLDLVLDPWQMDEYDDLSPNGYAEYVFEERAPKNFIIDVRTKFGEDFNFIVNTQYHTEDSLIDYPRSDSSFVDILLYKPLSIARGDTSSSDSDQSSGDDYDSEDEDDSGSDSKEDEASTQPAAEESEGYSEEDESMGGSEASRYDEYGLGYDKEGSSAEDDEDESITGSEDLCLGEYGSEEDDDDDEDASAEDVFMESDGYISSD